MTRLLVFSDIHGAVPAVHALVRVQRKRFDAIVVAGDIGPAPTEFFRALEPLEAPVLYVYGNWDCRLSYEHRFHPRFHHLHGSGVRVGDLYLVGFSGCPTQWGQNPHWQGLFATVMRRHRKALERIEGEFYPHLKEPMLQRYVEEVSAAWGETLVRNRREVLKRIEAAPCARDRVVLVTHERLFRLQEEVQGLGAHLFGHRHGFRHTRHQGTALINVSALDPLVACGGTYGILEWTATKGFSICAEELAPSSRLGTECLKFKAAQRGIKLDASLSLPVIQPMNPFDREPVKPPIILKPDTASPELARERKARDKVPGR